MYKKIDYGDNKIELQEHFNSPMVYLDHWALNDLSLNSILRNRFVKLMNEKAGTFRLSLVNIAELINQSDKSQVNSILDMIDSITDCGFINVDHNEVIKKENILIADPLSISVVQNPSAEIEIVKIYLMAHNYPDRWHVSDVIRSALSESPSKYLNESNIDFLQHIQRVIKKCRTDEKCLKRALNRFRTLKTKGPQYEAPTRELLQMAIDFVVRNTGMKMLKYSEWQDLFHVIVPVSYCDLVLIDRRWQTFISQTGFSYLKIAKVFDKSSLENFFETIENWEHKNKIL
jgi:hypothetical protein